jgi:hypothetical protein
MQVEHDQAITESRYDLDVSSLRISLICRLTTIQAQHQLVKSARPMVVLEEPISSYPSDDCMGRLKENDCSFRVCPATSHRDCGLADTAYSRPEFPIVTWTMLLGLVSTSSMTCMTVLRDDPQPRHDIQSMHPPPTPADMTSVIRSRLVEVMPYPTTHRLRACTVQAGDVYPGNGGSPAVVGRVEGVLLCFDPEESLTGWRMLCRWYVSKRRYTVSGKDSLVDRSYVKVLIIGMHEQLRAVCHFRLVSRIPGRALRQPGAASGRVL